MPDTGRTMSEIDTMLTLRRVPLFEGLDPEDLQRIATTCRNGSTRRARHSSVRASSVTS